MAAHSDPVLSRIEAGVVRGDPAAAAASSPFSVTFRRIGSVTLSEYRDGCR
jgi:hypothetical protein